MKLLQAHDLEEILTSILNAAGTPTDIAQTVAASLVDSDLKGVDSHGAIRCAQYVDQILAGYIQPASRPEIVRETASTSVVRGHLGFGILALGHAVDIAIGKAKTGQIAAVGLTETTHTGRIGRYAELAAEQNLFALVAGGGGSSHPAKHASVSPFGGARRLLATNPFAFGLPGGRFGPVIVDTSTSMTAEGKLRVYRATGEPLPEGWIVDKAGHPSTDAEDFYAGGAILPAAGHKGYGLALIAELLGIALLGEPYELNWMVIALDIEAFRALDDYVDAGEETLQKIKEVPPALGFERVLIPGEPESRMAEKRALEGIPISDSIWRGLVEAAAKVHVSL